MMCIRHMRVRVLHGVVFVWMAVRAGGQYVVRMQVMTISLFWVMAVCMFML